MIKGGFYKVKIGSRSSMLRILIGCSCAELESVKVVSVK